jgi:hypothetical protein
MSTINIILLALGAAAGFLFHLFTKPSGVNNKQTLDDVQSLQTKVDSNNTLIQNQQQIIIDNDKKAENEKTNPSTLSDDAAFLNSNIKS